jgi:hypothetical protein
MRCFLVQCALPLEVRCYKVSTLMVESVADGWGEPPLRLDDLFVPIFSFFCWDAGSAFVKLSVILMVVDGYSLEVYQALPSSG